MYNAERSSQGMPCVTRSPVAVKLLARDASLNPMLIFARWGLWRAYVRARLVREDFMRSSRSSWNPELLSGQASIQQSASLELERPPPLTKNNNSEGLARFGAADDAFTLE